MKRLGLDLDGVIYPWHQAVYTELVVYEDLAISFHDFWSKDPSAYRNRTYWDNLVQYRHLYGNQIPGEKLLNLMEYLAHKYSIYYISKRPKNVYYVTKTWLKKYNFPYVNNLILTQDKVTVCNSVGIACMVEDHSKHIRSLSTNGISTILISQPYNECDHAEFKQAGIPILNSILELGEIL